MPQLSDRLRSLGVKVGAQDIKPSQHPLQPILDSSLHGETLQTHSGETYVVNTHLPPGYKHGAHIFPIKAPLDGMAFWQQDQLVKSLPLDSFAFLDTETTGLSGGTGTYAFLIGVARFEGNNFHLAQFFMRDPAEEPAQLAALEEFLAPCSALVTFNGKAFDIPLLATRYLTHGWRAPMTELIHLDLLHLSRRLWRDRLPSRTLGNLEVQILGSSRTGEDIPGWMIPQIYFDYLRSGDPSQLRNVFYHNRMDVISLAALLEKTAWMLDDPLTVPEQDALDIIALAKLFEDRGDYQRARQLFIRGIALELPEGALSDTLVRLAYIYKRENDLEHAIEIWQIAASFHVYVAYLELAKIYEHRLKDYSQAIYWTKTAIEDIPSMAESAYERRQQLEELEHRLQRLQQKIK